MGVCSVDTEIDLALTVFDWTVTRSLDARVSRRQGRFTARFRWCRAADHRRRIIGWKHHLGFGGYEWDCQPGTTRSVCPVPPGARDTALVMPAARPIGQRHVLQFCPGAEDGAIEGTVSGGSEPLTLGAEGPGLLFEPFEFLSAGTYTVGVLTRAPRGHHAHLGRTRPDCGCGHL